MSKRPWNRINLPVYAVSSRHSSGKHNMHIITYATAISMQPKRFACGIYEGTQSLENISSNPHFVLQLLSASQYRLVDLLGKQSGKTTDKIARLQKRGLITEWNGFTILQESLAVMQMKVINQMNAGDHTLMLCDVVAYKNLHEGEPLTLDVLRQHKLIRI